MKHRLTGPIDANVTLNVYFHKDDVEDVIDKITESVVTIIAVASAAHILRKWVT